MPEVTVFTSIVNSYFPEPQASLLNGILFGTPIQSSSLFYQQLREVGLLHIVVLSGLNITLLSTFVSYASASFGRIISCMITILLIILYVLFVSPKAPIVRAAIMNVLTFAAIILGRRSLAIYSLLIAAIITAIFWPEWLTSLSFYLSYAATLGIILFSPISQPNTHSNNLSNFFLFVKNDLRTTFAASMFTIPILSVAFHQISLISPLANLLISFTIAPLMILGFATAIVGKINFTLGSLFAIPTYGLLTYMTFVIELVSQIPFGFVEF
ncbi:ComEC/Rec2 family competence protein [Candidatus Roizmanbacteria bacterium]|nr:ComEC/Rec2 family competence protein [Candidatus Roizmanbacteria bacterium]